MEPQPVLLLVGSDALRERLAACGPSCRIVHVPRALDAVWRAGRERYQTIVLQAGPVEPRRVVPVLRRLQPEARLILVCPTTLEPVARDTLLLGADDYLLDPPDARSIREVIFRLPARKAKAADAPAFQAPTRDELAALADVLRQIDDGPEATLARLAELVRETFGAAYVEIELDGHRAAAGAPAEIVLSEPIVRSDEAVGALRLALREDGQPYSSGALERLRDYARLIEITMRQTLEQQRWRELAWTDDLSGLRNRRYFEKRLAELIEHCARKRSRLTVLLFDIDNFKTYNDRYGHETGDELIREVARLLRQCTRSSDVVARFGGDEFAVIFWDADGPRVPGSHHPTEPVELTERFRRTIETHDFKCLGAQAPGPVTISGGLASYPWNGTSVAELIRAADQALLEAKRTGKNRIRLAGGPLEAEHPAPDEAR